MKHVNIEIKAKSNNHERIRGVLKSHGADFKGIDHQVDTYFKVHHGRLKLREGNVENHLIYYERENLEGPKKSDVILFRSDPGSSLKSILTNANGILAVVDKTREIYFIENVKFHLDNVKGLGTFVEIEAIDDSGTISEDKLLKQCDMYRELFHIADQDLISVSYSDLLLERLNRQS